MSEVLSAAAAALGIPEALVKRSAEARATETGMTVDEVLAAWAGGLQIDSPVEEASPSPAPDESQEEEVTEEQAEPVGEPISTAPAQAAAAVSAPVAAARAAVPAEVTAAEAIHVPEVVTVATAGIRERTSARIPTWIVAVFIIIPAFALFTLGSSATGTCGADTELTTDVVTGKIVNCDGSEFTGSGVGGGTADFIALGEAIYQGSGAAGVNCSGCHGPSGGGGVGPALNGVLTTFGSCPDHEEWVRLGSNGLLAAGRTTYGDTNKPIEGAVMPAHATLTDEQLASVVSFERVRFGGAEVDATLADCGLSEAEGGGGEPGASTTTVPGGSTGPTTTIGGESTPTTTGEATAAASPSS